MTLKNLRLPGILILLSQGVPLSACTRADDDKGKDKDKIRETNDCQVEVECDSARFAFSDALVPGEYRLHFGLQSGDVYCSVVVDEDEQSSNDCDLEGLELDDEGLEMDSGSQPIDLSITDANGCSASAAVSASDYLLEIYECDNYCEGARATVDLSDCAEDWDPPQERPECEIGYDWSEVCADYFAGNGTQIIEGCGYTWVRALHADSQRDTIVDADGMVVFQEWKDPLSTVNPLGCLGGAIPDCADLPDDTNNDWDGDLLDRDDPCIDDGMGGMGGMSAGGAGGAGR